MYFLDRYIFSDPIVILLEKNQEIYSIRKLMWQKKNVQHKSIGWNIQFVDVLRLVLHVGVVICCIATIHFNTATIAAEIVADIAAVIKLIMD